MSAVWLRVRSDARRRWRAWIGLALILGIAAGTAMALAQAARRSEHAYERFVDHGSAADVVMTGFSTFGLVGGVNLDKVAQSEFVARSAGAFAILPFSGHTDTGASVDAVDLFAVAANDRRLGTSVERWKMLAGRPANPNAVGEATASFLLAERLGLHVGSHLDLRLYRADTFPQVEAKIAVSLASRVGARADGNESTLDYADGPTVRFTVVGIEASAAEFPPLINELSPVLHLTPAFEAKYAGKIAGSPIAYMKLRPGRDLKSFQLDVERMAAGKPVSFVSTRENQGPKVQRTIRWEALALAIVAVLVGFAGAVGLSQAMTRQALTESSGLTTLRALGMRNRQLRAIAVLRLLVIGVLGVVVASVITIFGAQYALLPLARKADLDPGAHVDWWVLAAGAAIVVALVVLVALWSTRVALKSEQVREGGGESKRAKAGALSMGSVGKLPLTMTLGVRFALHSAKRAVPAWATVLATGLTIALLVGTLTFTASLHRLLNDPPRYGWNWDVKIGAAGLPDFSSFLLPQLLREPAMTDVSYGTVTQVDVGKSRFDVLGLDRASGDAMPTILDGRAPSRRNEIALGAKTMQVLGVRIGDAIDARIGSRVRTLRVVGQPVLPEFGDAGQLGTGSLMTLAGMKTLLPDAPANSFIIRLGGSTDPRADAERLARAVAPVPLRVQARPEDLVELSRGGGLLTGLVALLALLGFAVLGHALVTVVRARRRDFAMLRALGLSRGQIRASVIWQVLTLVVGALLLGLFVGVVLGRFAWLTFAHQLGVAPDAVGTPLALLAVAAGAIAIALFAAAFPAFFAARSRPAEALHAE